MNVAIAYLMSIVHTTAERLEGRKDRGVTALEYGLIAALIAVVIIAAVRLLGTSLSGVFNTIAGSL